jgi:hypothetical protein
MGSYNLDGQLQPNSNPNSNERGTAIGLAAGGLVVKHDISNFILLVARRYDVSVNRVSACRKRYQDELHPPLDARF